MRHVHGVVAIVMVHEVEREELDGPMRLLLSRIKAVWGAMRHVRGVVAIVISVVPVTDLWGACFLGGMSPSCIHRPGPSSSMGCRSDCKEFD
jgi:hypothetical protein